MIKAKNLIIWIRGVTTPFEFKYADMYIEDNKQVVISPDIDSSGAPLKNEDTIFEFPVVNMEWMKYKKY